MLLLGLDIGTTTIKAAAYDPESGRVVGFAARPTPTDHPAPGLSEHDPEALWEAVCACLRELTAALSGRQIAGLAIASLAESGVPVDAAGQPLCPIIAWYDRRSEPQATWLHQQIDADEMHAITGQRATASFGVCKWLWIRKHWPDAAARMATWLPVPSYLLLRLTGAVATDHSQASRMLTFDQRSRDWSDRICEVAGLRRDQLPPAFPGGTVIGTITAAAASADRVAGRHAVCARRTRSSVRGAGGRRVSPRRRGRFIGHGSGGADRRAGLRLHAEDGRGRLCACYAHVLPDQYILKAGLKAAGGAVEWLARQLAGPGTPLDRLPYDELLALAERGVGVRAGPIWLPHFIDSGTPEGDRHSLAALVGAKIEHDAGDIFRGLLESLAFWLRHNLEDVGDLPIWQPVEEVILLGGTTRLALLSQLKADILGRPVIVPELPEAAAIGAALLAGLGAGVFRSPAEAVGSLRYGRTIIEPDPARVIWYDRLYREAYLPLYDALREVNHRLAAM